MNTNDLNESKNKNDTLCSEIDLSYLCDESVLKLIDEPFEALNKSRLRTDNKFKGFDPTKGNTWIYPTNYPKRAYQYNISRACLFKNTLVIEKPERKKMK